MYSNRNAECLMSLRRKNVNLLISLSQNYIIKYECILKGHKEIM